MAAIGSVVVTSFAAHRPKTCGHIHPTTASIAARPFLSSHSRISAGSRHCARFIGSQTVSPVSMETPGMPAASNAKSHTQPVSREGQGPRASRTFQTRRQRRPAHRRARNRLHIRDKARDRRHAQRKDGRAGHHSGSGFASSSVLVFWGGGLLIRTACSPRGPIRSIRGRACAGSIDGLAQDLRGWPRAVGDGWWLP